MPVFTLYLRLPDYMQCMLKCLQHNFKSFTQANNENVTVTCDTIKFWPLMTLNIRDNEDETFEDVLFYYLKPFAQNSVSLSGFERGPDRHHMMASLEVDQQVMKHILAGFVDSEVVIGHPKLEGVRVIASAQNAEFDTEICTEIASHYNKISIRATIDHTDFRLASNETEAGNGVRFVVYKHHIRLMTSARMSALRAQMLRDGYSRQSIISIPQVAPQAHIIPVPGNRNEAEAPDGLANLAEQVRVLTQQLAEHAIRHRDEPDPPALPAAGGDQEVQ